MFRIHGMERRVDFNGGKSFRFGAKSKEKCFLVLEGVKHWGERTASQQIEWESLDCYWVKTSITHLVEKALDSLHQECSLSSLDFGGQRIGDHGVEWIAAALQENNSVTNMTLNLRLGGLGPIGASHVAAAIEKSLTLTSLDLSRNRIGGRGAEHIAGALKISSSLTFLDLSGNTIGDVGAVQVAHALAINDALRTLNLSQNEIGNAGAEQIAVSLHSNTQLTALDLSFNIIGEVGLEQLQLAVGIAGMMRLLELRGNCKDLGGDISQLPWR